MAYRDEDNGRGVNETNPGRKDKTRVDGTSHIPLMQAREVSDDPRDRGGRRDFVDGSTHGGRPSRPHQTSTIFGNEAAREPGREGARRVPADARVDLSPDQVVTAQRGTRGDPTRTSDRRFSDSGAQCGAQRRVTEEPEDVYRRARAPRDETGVNFRGENSDDYEQRVVLVEDSRHRRCQQETRDGRSPARYVVRHGYAPKEEDHNERGYHGASREHGRYERCDESRDSRDMRRRKCSPVHRWLE